MRPKGLRRYYQAKYADRTDAGSSVRRPPVKKPRGRRHTELAVAAMKARFLLAYARTGLLNKTCEALEWPASGGQHLTVHMVRHWADKDPAFASAVSQARITFAESLEEEAHRRAVIGVRRPIYYRGEKVDEVAEYSDQLLITLLKANLPEKYRERIDLSVDVHAEIRRMAEELGVPVELAESEWSELEPLLLGKGKG